MRKTAFLLGCFFILTGLQFSQNIREISAEEAFTQLKEPATYLIDVRSIAEYVFVGHPEQAYNIPLHFWNEKEQEMNPNENFLVDIRSRFKPEATLIFICRSGKRSAQAARILAAAGFNKVFNLKHGFEGDKDDRGYRSRNGWKNNGLPYTYGLNDKLVYRNQ
jgi:rhodanese-related sulfurtransferase